MSTSRIGIIGCGNISPAYANTLADFPWIEIAAFADGIPERAEKFAERYGGVPLELTDMLGDDSIDAVVNLTPAHAHTNVSRLCLEAGKPVFSEKPLGTDFDEGVSLVELAGQRGLRLGCAPDTFLGAGLQAARTAIDRGLIGEPIAANGFMLGFGPEWWHPNPESFYGPGAGPLFDMGPYYLTTLVHLLGPARSISGSAKIGIAERVVHSKGRVGDVVQATTPTHVSSMIDFVSGASATLVTSFDVEGHTFQEHRDLRHRGNAVAPGPQYVRWAAEGTQHHRRRLARDPVADAQHPTAAWHRAGGHAVGNDRQPSASCIGRTSAARSRADVGHAAVVRRRPTTRSHHDVRTTRPDAIQPPGQLLRRLRAGRS